MRDGIQLPIQPRHVTSGASRFYKLIQRGDDEQYGLVSETIEK